MQKNYSWIYTLIRYREVINSLTLNANKLEYVSSKKKCTKIWARTIDIFVVLLTLFDLCVYCMH